VFPYEQLLGKDAFVEVLKSRGLNDEETENEWKRLIVLFNATFADGFAGTLPKEKRDELREGLDITNRIEDADTYFERVMELVKSDTNSGLLLDLAKKSAKMAVDIYTDKFEERMKLKNE